MSCTDFRNTLITDVDVVVVVTVVVIDDIDVVVVSIVIAVDVVAIVETAVEVIVAFGIWMKKTTATAMAVPNEMQVKIDRKRYMHIGHKFHCNS